MEITNEHIDRPCMWTERGGVVKYGTIKEIVNKFVDVHVDGSSRAHYFVPIDTIVLVDEDGTPLQVEG